MMARRRSRSCSGVQTDILVVAGLNCKIFRIGRGCRKVVS